MKADKILINGNIHTEDETLPLAEAVAFCGKKILRVGSNEACLRCRDAGSRIIDLRGKTAIPGLLDGHTHPTTVAKTIWHTRMPLTHDKDQLLQTLRTCAAENPREEVPYFYGECYYAETFGSEGPRKELLDEIFPDRPVRVQDFTDHACWYNSVALDMLGISDGTGAVASPIGDAEFIRDEKGAPTGWALEPAPDGDLGVYEATGWYPPKGTEEESVTPFLDYLKRYGITGIMDGFTESEEVLKTFYEMDRAGRLNMYYEGTSLMGTYEEMDEAIRRLRDWQEKYTTDHIRINTIKFFLDGTNEMGDSASLEPLKCDPSGENYGMMSMEEDQLADVLVRLNQEKLDIHIHVVCDRGFRVCCNAVEKARRRCRDQWEIYVTLCHCELIHPADMERVAELGIFIDWSTHWAGGYFGEAGITYLGRKRWDTMYDFTRIIETGGIVGFSSDLFSYQEANRGNPYFGMQTSMTRVDIEYPLGPEKFPGSVRPPEHAKLTLEQLLRGYTCNNARRMRLLDKAGTIQEGKLANLIVLNKDIFSTPPFEVKTVKPEMVFFEGAEQELKEVTF